VSRRRGGGGELILLDFFPLTTSKGKIRFQAFRISRMLLVIRWTDDKPKAFVERGGCKEKLVLSNLQKFASVKIMNLKSLFLSRLQQFV
jgi:hypothetical protein